MSERAAPAWLRVDTPQPGYADRVVADVTRVVAVPSGRALLEQVRDSGHGVLIEKPALVGAPNAHVRPQSLRAATASGVPTGEIDAAGRPVLGTGEGSDSIIAYEPLDWPSPLDPDSPSSDVMLFALLGQALAQLRGTAEPLRYQMGEMAPGDAAEIERYQRERGDG
jgi:hypothetical protein